ncbi:MULTISPECIES: sorbosone dehydrogenase family protein [unclassified Roseovarius]|uniref:PQQ-dependent sugar dehydrogenase n=1 Tax=unclassified Roseovarius TaxID=2614913 RepID=UPI00273F51E3|nr:MULTISPECIES: PQQ-dependent sugar dehydrogenase [unclassified Roseovarius]
MKRVLHFLTAAMLALPAHGQTIETVLPDLNYPWDIEASKGSLYITEKAGTLSVLENGELLRLPVVTSVPILDDRGGGLLGLALRPDFTESGRVILYQHHGTSENRRNRVIEVVRDGNAWRETRVLVEDIPGHPLYNGGRVAFGPDGMLYVTTGWTENRERPQDLQSLAGKVLRVTPEGDVPGDNPFPGSPVYSLGHRNPQGLAWNDDGVLFVAEHGQSGQDEVNRVEAGGNYGWPLIKGDETRDGMHAPLAQSGGTTWAPSGLAWDGETLLLAGLRAQGVLAVTEDGEVREAFHAGERIRDIVVTQEGILAITTNRSPRGEGASRDRLIRILP